MILVQGLMPLDVMVELISDSCSREVKVKRAGRCSAAVQVELISWFVLAFWCSRRLYME